MKFSLSGRLWETSDGYRSSLVEQIPRARSLGYDGLEIRYPLLPAESEMSRIRELLAANRLEAVLAFLAKIPRTPEDWNDAMRVLKTLQALDIPFARVAVFSAEELPLLRELADRAADHGIGLLLHLHIDTWCDRPGRMLEAVETVNRPNVGVLFDPAHVTMAGDLDMAGAIRELGSLIRFINIQNLRPADPGETEPQIKGYCGGWICAMPEDPKGLPIKEILSMLQATGYEGWVNVMAAIAESEAPDQVARRYMEWLTNRPSSVADKTPNEQGANTKVGLLTDAKL